MPACIIRPARCARSFCPRGNRMLYEFCETHGVAQRRCGKLIVATNDAERARIEAIHAQGLANGVEGLELIGGNAARAMEPELNCVAALLSPSTGIIDGHGYMLALQGDLEAHGGAIAFETPVTAYRADAARLSRIVRRRRARAIRGGCGGELRRPVGAEGRANHRGLSARPHSETGAGEGQLFRLCRQAGLHAADLSDAGRWRPGRACHARSRRAHALRAGRAMDRD